MLLIKIGTHGVREQMQPWVSGQDLGRMVRASGLRIG
jgi:hypothetical protein